MGGCGEICLSGGCGYGFGRIRWDISEVFGILLLKLCGGKKPVRKHIVPPIVNEPNSMFSYDCLRIPLWRPARSSLR